MISLDKNYINIAFQGFYEITPNEGYTLDNTFNFVSSIIHSWIRNKFGERKIPLRPHSWSWGGISRNIEIYYDYDNRVYCMKVAHTDGIIADRVWMVDATAFVKDDRLYLAAKCSYTAGDRNKDYTLCNPPKFVKDIGKKCAMTDAGETMDRLHTVQSDEDAGKLFLIITDTSRVFPVIVISADQNEDEDVKILFANEEGYHIDGDKLADSLKYIAHVYYLPAEYQKKFIEHMTPKWGVEKGAVRTYNTGFDFDDEEGMSIYDHPEAFPKNILAMSYINEDGQEYIAGHGFRHLLTHRIKLSNMYQKMDWARTSTRFYNQLMKEVDDQTEESLDALKAEIQRLKKEISDLELENNYYVETAHKYEIEINKRNSENIHNQKRITDLKDALEKLKANVKPEYPKSYEEIPDWAFEQFAGRLELHKRAIKCLKEKPLYPDIELVCRSIDFLGNEYYNMKMGKLDQEKCEEVRKYIGIKNELTGSVKSAGRQIDAYYIERRDSKHFLEMHIKGGKSMNSSDPRERFRIYYYWDNDDNRVIIGYLPDHLPLSNN